MKFSLTIDIDENKISLIPQGDQVKAKFVRDLLLAMAKQVAEDALDKGTFGESKVEVTNGEEGKNVQG
jgi:hypothetical protein